MCAFREGSDMKSVLAASCVIGLCKNSKTVMMELIIVLAQQHSSLSDTDTKLMNNKSRFETPRRFKHTV